MTPITSMFDVAGYVSMQLQDILQALSFLNDAFLVFVESLKHFPKKQSVDPCILQHKWVKFSW